jgi:hypothetical protein
MGMRQRTAIRLVIGLALLALLLPRFFGQFHGTHTEAPIVAGLTLIAIGASSFFIKPRIGKALEPAWGYSIPEPYRTGVQVLIIVAGVGLLAWGIM